MIPYSSAALPAKKVRWFADALPKISRQLCGEQIVFLKKIRNDDIRSGEQNVRQAFSKTVQKLIAAYCRE
jgi:hypothetical protein